MGYKKAKSLVRKKKFKLFTIIISMYLVKVIHDVTL